MNRSESKKQETSFTLLCYWFSFHVSSLRLETLRENSFCHPDPDLCLSVMVFTIGRFGETLVTFMFLLFYCAENLQGVPWFFSNGNFPFSYPWIILQRLRADTQDYYCHLLMLAPIAGNFPKSQSRAWCMEKVTHSQRLPTGKQGESPHLLWNAGAYYPEIWQQLPHEISAHHNGKHFICTLPLSLYGDHQQMTWRLCGIFTH